MRGAKAKATAARITPLTAYPISWRIPGSERKVVERGTWGVDPVVIVARIISSPHLPYIVQMA
ncbi:hypothetical protein D3C84_1155800 [compost metagenome]